MVKTGISLDSVKNNNKSQILKILQKTDAMSRKDIANQIGLTPAAVTMLCNDMMEAHMILEKGEMKEQKRAGRKKVLVDINYDFKYIVSVNIEAVDTSITVTNIRGNVLVETKVHTRTDIEPQLFLEELAKYHVSGQLRVAPEHVSDRVLSYMGKPEHQVYQKFLADFEKANKKTGKKQYVVPYFMSSHPGCTLKDAVKLAEYVRDMGFMPEQVQDFYPTPSTMSTCMYYTGYDCRTMEKVYVPVNPHEKAMQRALIQYRNPKNYDLVHEALVKAGREDLIGFDKKCLIKPRKMHTDGGWDKKTSKSDKNSNSSYGSGKNAGVRKNLKNATERGKNGSGSNTAGTAHKKKTIRNVHKKKR